MEGLTKYKINQIDNKRLYGRFAKTGSGSVNNAEGPLAVFWAASGVEFRVKASEFWILVEADYDTAEPWLSVKVNGSQVSRQPVLKGQYWICVMRNMNPAVENTLLIQKDTQPMTGEATHCLLIHEVAMSENGVFCSLPEKSMNIEFVGDSITSGEGLYGSVTDMDWIPQNFGATKTYAVQIAEKLNAVYSVISQCGWGIVWGWDGNRNSVIPPHYENVCSVMWGQNQVEFGAKETYDFNFAEKQNGKVDFVIVNLGTNDNGAFFQPAWKDENGVIYQLSRQENDVAVEEDGKKVGKGVYDFLKVIRAKNPDAKIIWVWGMIKLVATPPYVIDAIEQYKKDTGDNKVYDLELDSMEDVEKTLEDKGSRGHPGPKTHRLAAEKIIDFINQIK